VAGMPALLDLRGELDLFGYELRISVQGYADLVASAAHLLTGEGREGKPVVLVRGLNFPEPYGAARDLNRPREKIVKPVAPYCQIIGGFVAFNVSTHQSKKEDVQ